MFIGACEIKSLREIFASILKGYELTRAQFLHLDTRKEESLRVPRIWLKKRRNELGLSQTAFAKAANVSERTVQRWEAGVVEPGEENRIDIAVVLKMSEAEVLAQLETDMLSRLTKRELLKLGLVQVSAHGGMVPGGFNVTSDVVNQNDLSPADELSHLRRTRINLVSLDATFGSHAIVSTLKGILEVIVTKVADASTSRDRNELLELGAMYAEFASWLFEDSGDLLNAQGWLTQALKWAQASTSHNVEAYIIMRKTQQASLLSCSQEAIQYGETIFSKEGIPGRVRASTLIQLGHGYSIQDSENMALSAFDDAYTILQGAQDNPTGPFNLAGFCSVAYFHAQRAECLNKLGKHAEAVLEFDEALSHWPSTYRRERGLHMSRKSVALALAGQVEEAISVAESALVLVNSVRSARAIMELSNLDSYLRSYGVSGARVDGFRDMLRNTNWS